MNWPAAVYCGGCGHELGLSPASSGSDKACPHCSTKLSAVAAERGTLLDCSECGGQFAPHALLRELLTERERLATTALAAALRQPRRALLELGAVRYAGCPECGELMNRKNFGGTSGIVIDVCHRHGTWFEAGELAGVLAFVESGGVAKASTASAAASFVPSVALIPSDVSGAASTTTSGVELAEWAGELLLFLYELLD